MTKIKLDFVHEFVDRHGNVRRYVRRHGKRTPLPGLPGSAEFLAAYAAAIAEIAPLRAIGATRTMPGTINALVVEFYASAGFQTLAPITKATYRGIIERIRAEHGDRRVAKLETEHVRRMRDTRAAKPGARGSRGISQAS